MKLYEIRIDNTRGNRRDFGLRTSECPHAVLPSDYRFDKFATEAEACERLAKDLERWIYDDACNSVSGNIDGDEYINAVGAAYEAARAEVVKNGCASYDGVRYAVWETREEYGQLWVGVEDGDHLINIEPVGGEVLKPDDLYIEDDAESQLRDEVAYELGEYEIVDEPYGWTVKWTDDDGENRESHYCWRAAPEPEVEA